MKRKVRSPLPTHNQTFLVFGIIILYSILYYIILYCFKYYILYCTILLQLYKVIFHHSICVYMSIYMKLYINYIVWYHFYLLGCSVFVGRYGIFPCAAFLKSLQGIKVRFHFVVFQWHCKLLLITLLIKASCSVSSPNNMIRSCDMIPYRTWFKVTSRRKNRYMIRYGDRIYLIYQKLEQILTTGYLKPANT